MHHENGQGGHQFQGVVPVGDAVQGVAHRGVKAQVLRRLPAVNGVRGARQGAAAQGALVEALFAVLQAGNVPGKHVGVGHQVLSEGDGLGPLQVGVAGHDGGLVLLRLLAQNGFQLQKLVHDDGDLLPDVHPEVQGHLVVAAAGGVEPLAGVADAGGQEGLHVHVDVLVVGGEFHLAGLHVRQDAFQALGDGGHVLLGDDAAVAQHLRVGQRAGDVLLVQPLIELNGGVEVVDEGVGLLAEPPGPEFHRWFLSLQTRGEERFSVPQLWLFVSSKGAPYGGMNPHFLFGCAEKKTAVHGQKKRRFGAKPAPKGAFFA